MSYHHLSRKERGMIALWENNRVPRREIARRLHRSPSTISRELANGKGEGRYRADEAQKRSVLRRQASHRTLRYQDPWIQQYVREKLSQCWSPEQIAGRLRREYPQEPAKWVSCSSIYRWLKKGLLEQSAALQVHLRHYKHQHGEKRGRFHGIRELNERSRQALWRKRVGDWEVDTNVASNRKGCLLSVCDRKKLPLKTMTGDRGKEFACYQEVEETFGDPLLFHASPFPWQKPSVENLNGLVRQFFPRGTNFREISQQEVSQVMDMLNPRVWSFPSTMASRPLVRKRETNSAVCRQATMLMKSALRSPVSRSLKSRSTAKRKEATAMPFWVWRSSGSATSRPCKRSCSASWVPPYSSLQMIMERMTPSVIFSTRSSSAGSAGAAVKVIRT